MDSQFLVLVDTIKLICKNISFNGNTSVWNTISSFEYIKNSISSIPEPKFYGSYTDDNSKWKFEMKGNIVVIKGSIPNLINGNSVKHIFRSDIETVKKYIVAKAEYLGLVINIEDLQISRIDLARNTSLSFPVDMFVHEISRLNRFNRMIKKVDSEVYQGTYVLWSNNQRSLCFYDKASLSKNDLQGNWIRCETRLLNQSSCKKAGFTKFTDLYDSKKQYLYWSKVITDFLEASTNNGLIKNESSKDLYEELNTFFSLIEQLLFCKFILRPHDLRRV